MQKQTFARRSAAEAQYDFGWRVIFEKTKQKKQ